MNWHQKGTAMQKNNLMQIGQHYFLQSKTAILLKGFSTVTDEKAEPNNCLNDSRICWHEHPGEETALI